ncbi:putative 3-phosphoinositide-dependent protein kinase 2 [Octopus sinensis]|uniref:non-specific serine/threonine protein kinase n=1 Tax=Octopus sinensis TaxID=2607531 RepID=A0A6P7TTX8_9MOLL|nr:putative 3-phosphoinositide-dependent protein kinase 2 [Octopus sinensis]
MLVCPHFSYIRQENESPSANKEENYQFIKPIGEGTFSTVYLCHHRTKNVEFAIKKCSKATIIKKKANKHVLMEKNILTKINNLHPLIINLVETFQSPEFLFFVFEYCKNGDLLELIEKRWPLSADSVIFYILQVVSALEFIHGLNIVHRDLKPANILLDSNMNVKLCDFGSATILPRSVNLKWANYPGGQVLWGQRNMCPPRY